MTDPQQRDVHAQGHAELIACETCGGDARELEGSTRGEQLRALLYEQLHEHGGELPNVTVTSTRCLWACTRSCAVHLRSPGRVGYVIGDLAPSKEFAVALLELAKLYTDTPDGAVPLKQRPQALRGHFICRVPAERPSPRPSPITK